MAPGDEFTATYKILNHELEDCEARLALALPDGISLLDGKDAMSAQVAKGGSATFRARLKAAKCGALNVSYKVFLGDKSFEGNDIVNVRPAVPFATEVRNAVLLPGEVLELGPATDGWTEVGERTASISASPAMAVKDALDWLNAYPYGCLEQTTSKAFPLMAVEGLVKAGIVDQAFKEQAAAKMGDAAVDLLSMMRGRRGFVGWPDTSEIWNGPGAYASHFLLKSRPGILTEEAVEDISAYLESMVNGIYSDNSIEGAYAFYVRTLARSRDNKAVNMADRILRASEGSGLARFLVGAGLYNAGFAARGIPLVRDALDARAWEESGNMPWFLDSFAVRTGLVLSIAMETVPEHSANPVMAEALARRLRGDGKAWGSTKDNSFAAYGLAAFAQYYGVGDVKVLVATGGEQGRELAGSGVMGATLGQDGNAVIKNTGNAPAFVRVRTEGIPAKLENASEGIEIRKELLDMEGRPVAKIRHGDLLTMRIILRAKSTLDNAVLVDLIPGGFAIENGSLATRSGLEEAGAMESRRPVVKRQECLDDRFLLFGIVHGGEAHVTYRLRAVTPGIYAMPPVSIEDMYEPDKHAVFAPGGTVEIEP